MKKKVSIIISIIIALILILFIGTGFTKNPNVEIVKYSVNEGGSELNFTVGIPYSIAYTRGYKNKGGGVKSHYLNFYNTFGVINSSLGTKFEYVLELDEDDTEMLKLGLQKFKETDGKRKKILITCKDFNIPSIRVIEKNNGVYEKSYHNEDDGFTYLRYWIEL